MLSDASEFWLVLLTYIAHHNEFTIFIWRLFFFGWKVANNNLLLTELGVNDSIRRRIDDTIYFSGQFAFLNYIFVNLSR